MTDHTPPTDQQLDDIEDLRAELAKLIRWRQEDATAFTEMRDTITRLRAEAARRVQCNDCGAVGGIFTGDDGRAYLEPSGQIGHTAP
jgi:hypothetical protein